MKKIFLHLCAVLLCAGSVSGQCQLSNVFLMTQSQVDEFIINYPDCDKIGGTLYIGNSWNDIQDIVDLSPLSQIDTIVGGLRVFGNEYLTTLGDLSLEHVGYININSNYVLTNLEGLEDVTTISGYVSIYENGSLIDLEGLNGLTSVEDYVHLEDNAVLSNIDALENLTTIGSYLQIKNNPNLATVDGLRNLVSVGDYLDLTSNQINGTLGLNSLVSVGDYMHMQWNGFNSLEGLSNLSSIGGDLTIAACWSLSDFVGLEGITSVDELEITGSNVLNFEGLNNINSVEELHIENNPEVTNIDALSALNFVDGRITIRENDALTNLNGLTNIDSIAGSVIIYENCSLTDVSGINNVGIKSSLNIEKNCMLPNLNGMNNVYIGGGLEVFDNNQLASISGLDITQDTLGFLKIWANDDLTNLSGLQSVRAIPNNFLIANNYNLVSLFGLRNLKSAGDVYLQNNRLTDLNGLDSLQIVTSDLEIIAHDDLQQIDALANVTSVGRNLIIRSNDNLQNIDGLQNITSIEGYVRIEENNQLKNLEGLSSVTSVDGYIEIIDNDDITTLNGLQNISSATDYLTIHGNYELTTIEALLNLDLSDINNLTITTNVGLTICNTPNICEYLIEGGIADISSNGFGEYGCANASQILDNCSTNVAEIYAQVFYDANQNKVQDPNEQIYSDGSIIIEPGNFTVFPNIDDNKFFLQPNNYTVTFNQNSALDWQLTTDASGYEINALGGQTYTVAFGLFPNDQISKLQAYISSPPTRCNESIRMKISTKNLGTTIADGTMWLTIDENITNFEFIDEPDTTITAIDTYYGWYFTDLYPGYTLTKQVEVRIPGPPDFMPGEILFFTAYTEFTDVNGENSSEGFRYNPEVRCSYDPNDKLVNPNREGNYTLFEEDLIYTIRFQNTGNDVAYDVVILDTLDTNLDKNTFRLLGSSHADVLNTSMSENGIVTFEFKDIFLPDSTSNLEGSQGQVTYLISTIDGLAENTPVTNSAGIYFDLNPPIITNTTESVMVSELPVVSTVSSGNSLNINIFPNPNAGIFEVHGISQVDYKIYNVVGQIIQVGDLSSGAIIDISYESSGVYFLHIDNGKQVATMKLVKK